MKRCLLVLCIAFLSLCSPALGLEELGTIIFSVGDIRILNFTPGNVSLSFLGVNTQAEEPVATLSVNGDYLQVRHNQSYEVIGLIMKVNRFSVFTVPKVYAELTLLFLMEPTCEDGIRNQNETGIDCSGPCTPCANCTDRKKNQDESDLDCGGGCKGCDLLKACRDHSDCNSSYCRGQACSYECTDLVPSDGEADIDCGGICPRQCAIGQHCTAHSDCIGGLCDLVLRECAQASCTDQVRNQNETDLDCGGPCPGCAVGMNCTKNLDCRGKFCTQAGICAQASCTDQVRNQNETDVDCGGICLTCVLGMKCATDADCRSGYCGPDRRCRIPSCSDGIRNQDELSIDCGGICPLCEDYVRCPLGCMQAGQSCACNASINTRSSNLRVEPDKDEFQVELLTGRGFANISLTKVDEATAEIESGGRLQEVSVRKDGGQIALVQGTAQILSNLPIMVIDKRIYARGTEITLLPEAFAQKAQQIAGRHFIQKMVLADDFLCRTTGYAQANLLWLIPVDVSVSVVADARTGSIIKVEKPWWAFLAATA